MLSVCLGGSEQKGLSGIPRRLHYAWSEAARVRLHSCHLGREVLSNLFLHSHTQRDECRMQEIKCLATQSAVELSLQHLQSGLLGLVHSDVAHL